ncbi:hypothetical protein J8L70_12100 [Pseudoalteromonas sp. MMG010]|uniref:hypothetical protein n=1 Tax=Pseudoalteromonas sp. MMG010 TaxID=2822685 RepID=UPI001B3A647E|nr:hypothetical protein [Pseudoalteromonas sp. MMG010]MBQ4833987.1 hypothetical protein [Pseudoalteromonas sp. MMG010]
MLLTELFGFFSLSALSMWGFLMAFFFNAFVFVIGVNRNTTLLLSSFIMMISYSISDYFFNWLSIYNTTYLDWVVYDIATIAFLLFSLYFIKNKTPSFNYLLIGLSINAILAVFMFIDTSILLNNQPWFFWNVYTFSVLIVDLLMIAALIIDKDFLHLKKIRLIGKKTSYIVGS